jgi:NADPH:quinone reductase
VALGCAASFLACPNAGVRAARCKTHGPPISVVIEELPDPVAGPGEAVVRIVAAAVNSPDVLIIANRYQVSIPVAFRPGSEFAGVVESLGDGVSGLRVGDRVTGGVFFGTFAHRIVHAAKDLRVVPAAVETRTASAYSVVYCAAYHLMRMWPRCSPTSR